METQFIRQAIEYTGGQLRGHYIYKEFGLRGDAMVAFSGPCRVKEELVDWVDRKSGATIQSPRMVHFLVEHFGIALEEGVWRLRCLMGFIQEEIHQRKNKCILRRHGNDLFMGQRKLSVAIATSTPTSVVMHVGVNIETRGTPVPTVGLSQLGIPANSFARQVMKKYSAEVDRVHLETTKVRGVGEVGA